MMHRLNEQSIFENMSIENNKSWKISLNLSNGREGDSWQSLTEMEHQIVWKSWKRLEIMT